jgi:hypothetical protein
VHSNVVFYQVCLPTLRDRPIKDEMEEDEWSSYEDFQNFATQTISDTDTFNFPTFLLAVYTWEEITDSCFI